jgi:hypothetical protein
MMVGHAVAALAERVVAGATRRLDDLFSARALELIRLRRAQFRWQTQELGASGEVELQRTACIWSHVPSFVVG